METLYEYLLKNYKLNEPIFLADLQIEGMSRANLRQQIKKLTDAGKVKRFDNGVYFLPKKTIFKSGSQLSPEKVLECKYLRDKDKRCGYVSGLMFFNQMGLTTQVPMLYEVVSNKATNEYRETSLAKSRVIVRKPKVPVTESNYKVLQFLDLLKDVDVYSEITGKPLSLTLQLPSLSTSTGFTHGMSCSYSIPARSGPLYSPTILNGISLSPGL